MQNDTTPITLMLEHAVPVLPALLSKAMLTKSDIEETARYTDALFIPPGVLQRGRQLPQEFRKFAGCGGTLLLWTMSR